MTAGRAATASGSSVPSRPAEAFDAFVAAHGSRLLRTAYLLTGDHDGAEDLLRDTLTRAWLRWPRLAADDEPLSSVRRLLVTAAAGRRRGPHLDRRGARQRAVLVLAYHEDLTDGQVADVLGGSTAAVRAQRTRAVRALRSPDRLRADWADVERAVRRELADRAEEAGAWRVGGAQLRRAAERRRTARRRAALTTAAVLAALVAAGALLSGGPQPAPDGLPDEPTSSAWPQVDLGPERSWTSVRLSGEMLRRAVAAAGGSSDAEVLVSTRLPGSEQVLVCLGSETPDGWVRVVTVTFDSTEPGTRVRRGTGASYPSYGSLIAQPAHDGDGAVLVVLVPSTIGDTVEVTSSEPGAPPVRTSGFLHDRLAMVPIGGPEAVTGVRVLHRGAPRLETIPAGSLLGAEVPRNLTRVVASTGPQRPGQPVQVRTNGRVACRLTVGGWWPQGRAYATWNPVDAACADVDGSLDLLLTPGRDDAGVAGVAPAAARTVRLHWQGGASSDVATAGGDVNAFVGPVRRPAEQLVRAEAVDASGRVVATAAP